MVRNILLINTNQPTEELIDELFLNFKSKNYSLSLLSSNLKQLRTYRQHFFPTTRLWLGGKKRSAARFILDYLFFIHYFFVILIYYKLKNKISIIICQGEREKFISAIPAKLLGIKTVWLEELNTNYRQMSALRKKIFLQLAKSAKIITFADLSKETLSSMGIIKENISIMRPGIDVVKFLHQENIFNNLAKSGVNSHKKYFTIGTIIDLNYKQNLEILLQAVKICLSVIPNMQLIILGEGSEKSNFSWLVKKMGIDSLVWFVGQPDNIQKWLDSFDLFVVTTQKPRLADVAIILRIMNIGLPIIGPNNLCLENFVRENKTGSLIEAENYEMLARQIIKLQQNHSWRIELGRNAKEDVKNNFNLENSLVQLENILNLIKS